MYAEELDQAGLIANETKNFYTLTPVGRSILLVLTNCIEHLEETVMIDEHITRLRRRYPQTYGLEAAEETRAVMKTVLDETRRHYSDT